MFCGEYRNLVLSVTSIEILCCLATIESCVVSGEYCLFVLSIEVLCQVSIEILCYVVRVVILWFGY